MPLLDIQLCHGQDAAFAERLELLVSDWILPSVFFELAESERGLTAMTMFARLLRNVKVDAHLSFDVIAR